MVTPSNYKSHRSILEINRLLYITIDYWRLLRDYWRLLEFTNIPQVYPAFFSRLSVSSKTGIDYTNDISVLTRVSITTPPLSVSVNPHDSYYRSVVKERPPLTIGSISHMMLGTQEYYASSRVLKQ